MTEGRGSVLLDENTPKKRFAELEQELQRTFNQDTSKDDDLRWIGQHFEFFKDRGKSDQELEEELNALVYLLAYVNRNSEAKEDSIFDGVVVRIDIRKKEMPSRENYEQMIEQGLEIMSLARRGRHQYAIYTDRIPFLKWAAPWSGINYEKYEVNRKEAQQNQYAWYSKLQGLNKERWWLKFSLRVGTPLNLIPGVFLFTDVIPFLYQDIKKQRLVKGKIDYLDLVAVSLGGVILATLSPLAAITHFFRTRSDIEENDKKIKKIEGLDISTPTGLVTKEMTEGEYNKHKEARKTFKSNAGHNPDEHKVYNKPKKQVITTNFVNKKGERIVKIIMDAPQAKRFEKWQNRLKNEKKLSAKAKLNFFDELRASKKKSREVGKIVARAHDKKPKP